MGPHDILHSARQEYDKTIAETA
eukprot:gene8841-biopygen309